MSAAENSTTRDKKTQNLDELKATWNRIQEDFKNPVPNIEDLEATPSMVISVIGDSDSFMPRPWPKTVFQTALIEAAKSGRDTWILFRGYAAGVSKLIMDAYHNYEIMEFGTKHKKKSITDVDRHIKLISIAGKKVGQTNNEIKTKYYEINSDKGDQFLLDFEKYVSEQKVCLFGRTMDLKMPVPIAIIVCEGDTETISHIAKALEKNLPIIIMKGSGKAADLVLDYLENQDISRKKVWISFGFSFDEYEYYRLIENLIRIKEGKDSIGVFDLDHHDPQMLSSIIGKVVVACWFEDDIFQADKPEFIMNPAQNEKKENTIAREKTNQKKKFSLYWKRFQRNSVSPETDMNEPLERFNKVRQYVFDPKYSAPTSLPLSFFVGYQVLHESENWDQGGDGHILLLEALKGNRCDYVRVLLDQGVDLTMMDLAELYKQECEFQDDCSHMQWLLKQIEKSSTMELCYKKKKGKKIKEFMEKAPPVSEAARKICCRILKHEESRLERQEDVNISDILLWAIFANRKELAEICWLRGDDQLMTGLLCSAILKQLSKNANNDKEQLLSIDLEEHSKLFEQRCLALMDKMNEENRRYAFMLMDSIVTIWGIKSSPLAFAYENEMLDIVAHLSSQESVRHQWYNSLAPDFIPFLMLAKEYPIRVITAPVIRYMVNYVIFFTMLIMYSAFVLTSVSTKYYEQNLGRIFEYYVYFWGAGDLIEELTCCFGCNGPEGRSNKGYFARLIRYLADFWNRWDLLSHALLIAALFVRHFYVDETFTIARRTFALSLLVMYLRFLEVFLIFRQTGLTIILIKEMLNDLIKFLYVVFFVVLGVGIYFHANLWTDDQSIWSGDWTDWRIWTIIYYPYWQLYGEMNLGILEGREPENCTSNRTVWEMDPSQSRCSEVDWTVQGIAAIYLLFSNLLLVNIVIARFSYTFEKVQENSEKIWHFEKYKVLIDYEWRIPSPINLFVLPYRYFSGKDSCLRKCKKKEDKKKEAKKREDQYYKDLKEVMKDFQKIIALKIFNKL